MSVFSGLGAKKQFAPNLFVRWGEKDSEERKQMDLRLYYRKIRDIEASIADKFPIVVSQETTDGGKEGIMTEVPRLIAARLIVEKQARLASADEAHEFRESMAALKRAADQFAAAAKVQMAVLSSADFSKLRGEE